MKNRYERFYLELKRKIKLQDDMFIKLNEIKKESKLDKGLYNVINSIFYNDVWHSENLPQIKNGSNIEVLEFEFGSKINLINYLKNNGFKKENIPRLVKKLTNLKKTVKKIHTTKIPPLTLDFIKEIHKIIMKDLLINRGEIRKTIVKPSGSDYYYCLPQFILKRLQDLINFVNKELNKNPSKQNKLLLGCLFFTEFLLIHPFSNGNGRTARVLLSLFIDPPIPITFDSCSDNEYFSLLENRHTHINSAPIKLTKYILNAIYRSVANIHFLTVD